MPQASKSLHLCWPKLIRETVLVALAIAGENNLELSIHTRTGHTDQVWTVCFSPTAPILASGSHDDTVKFWDVQSGRCLHTRRPDRPYERTKISGATGLTPAQVSALKELGAVDERS